MAGSRLQPPPQPGVYEDLLRSWKEGAGDWAFLQEALRLWCRALGTDAAALYVEGHQGLELEVSWGSDSFPPVLGEAIQEGWAVVPLPGGAILHPRDRAGVELPVPAGEPLTLILALALRICGLQKQLKAQSFQVNYRGVELEALYDVGLAIASTLDLDPLVEEILLRAVSLLDARRGALYLVVDGEYRLSRSVGGAARERLPLDDPILAGDPFGEAGATGADLLPGARYFLRVPVAIEGKPRGLLVVGDKERRRGVGPFLPGDLRSLSLFANQAAIALENARLHREALEKERLEREMELAAEIQRQILPDQVPAVSGLEVAGWTRAARHVGGDHYDLISRDGGRLVAMVADVSGKGMPAALLVSILHSAFRLLLDRTPVGPDLLTHLNRHVASWSGANKFITLAVAEVDGSTGDVTYVSAGHHPSLLLGPDGTLQELPSGGFPLGLWPGATFQPQCLRLEPGDLLCLYSDGIVEAANDREEEFGIGRLQDLLVSHRDQSLSQLIQVIDRFVRDFSRDAPQADDQTLVLVRRGGG